MRQAVHRGITSVGELLPAVQYLAASCGPGASRVRPQTVADLDGAWLMQVVSVTCWQRPALDWRVAADEFAGVHGARIHAA